MPTTRPDLNENARLIIIQRITAAYELYTADNLSSNETRDVIADIIEDCGYTRKERWNDAIVSFKTGIKTICNEDLRWYIMQHGVIALGWANV